MKSERSVWIGFEPREADAYAVARMSARAHRRAPDHLPINGLVLSRLVELGLYSRPTSRRDGKLYDKISDAPMSTEFACSRFLVPHLSSATWTLFMDCDVLVRRDINELFDLADPTKAVMVVKHDYRPANDTKMDGQTQSTYPRKNWSSVMLFNLGHPANRDLTVEMVNSLPGRDLHRFCWLPDHLIGELPQEWNWLVGHSDRSIDPAIVHFTEGTPSMPGHENDPYSDEWQNTLRCWAA